MPGARPKTKPSPICSTPKLTNTVASASPTGASDTATTTPKRSGAQPTSGSVNGWLQLPWPPKELNPNARVHFMALSRAKKRYRTTCFVLARAARIKASGPVTIEFEFRPPDRRHRDDDNLVSAMKAGRDGIADALGINDNQFSMLPPVIGEPIPGGAVFVRVST